MNNTFTKTRNTRKKTLIAVVGSLILIAIATVVYGQMCRQCQPIAAIVEHEPGTLSDEEVARTLAITTTEDAVSEWNRYAVTFTLSGSAALSPIQQTRVMAIVHVAVNDAVNGITGKYATYLPRTSVPDAATTDAAAISAAYRALRGLFPSQGATLDNLYVNSLATHGVTMDDPGLAYGQACADAILAARVNDGSAQAQYDYTPPGAGTPGVWTRINNAPALLPGWGNVTPFVLRSGSQFRPEAPPDLTSDKYARDYNEIKEIGASNSPTRTALQSQIALFWRASPTAIWNPILRQALATRSFDLSDTARTYGLFYLAASDASVACWEAKYAYNFWRPQLAIRGGDLDGNPSTEADPTWVPFLPTPPHPEYPSGHTTNSSAMAFVLEEIFGEKLDGPVTVTLSGITREWYSFEEAVDEVIDARVYSGIHYRNSDVVGARQGRQVAQFVINHALQVCKGRRSACS